jgi:hypothetical protein
MHICNEIHVLLSTLSYMFRRLLRHLQGEHYRMLETIVTVITDLNMYCTLHGLVRVLLNNKCVTLHMCILLVYYRYNYYTNSARNGKLQDMKINLNLLFFILSFRRVLCFACFLLGNKPASGV